MKQEIKERIEKIQKGEVPEGYRKTKVGIIPDDWDVEKIGALTSSASGTTPSREKQTIYYTDGSHLWVKTTDLNNNFIKDTSEKVTQRALDETACKLLPKNTILVAMYGGFNQIGRTGLLTKEAACNQALTGIYPNDDFDSKYLQEVLNLRTFYWKKFAASSRKDPNITRNDVMQFPVPHSNKTEEKKIVEILSTWDKAIGLKEKLIEEKKKFKRGLMQKLLTGEMRFPEFTGDWEETRLGKKLTFIKKESIENPLNYRLLKVKLHLKGIEATENYPKPTENGRPYHLRYEGELLIGRQNFHNGGIGIIPKGMNGYIASNAVSSLKSSDDNLMHYYYYLSNPNFYKKVGHLIGGTGQKEISESMFKNLKMTLPSNDEEIKKISATIKTIYQDLEMENNILSQLKEQKRGLMQLLLTGIVRVEVN